MQNIAKMETEKVPLILTSEIERALSQIKSSKAPGEDQLVVDMITAEGIILSGAFQCSPENRNSA